MFNYVQAFSGFSVDDIPKAKAFYSDVLGLKVEAEGDALRLGLSEGVWVFAYPKPNHEPASFTVLNFVVEEIDKAVQALKDQGVTFEQYPDLHTGEDGIARDLGGGPSIAWFKDPAGNVIAVIQH